MSKTGTSPTGAETVPPPGVGLRDFLSEFRTLWRWMSPERRRTARWLFVLLVFSAIAELFTIGSVVPFLAILVGAETGGVTGSLLPTAHEMGLDPMTLMLWVGAVITFAAILSGGLYVGLSRLTQKWVHGLGHDLSVGIYARRLHQPYDQYVRGHSSTVISALDQVQGLVVAVLLPATNVIIAVVLTVVIVGLLVAVEPLVALATLLFIAMSYGGIILATRSRLKRSASILGALYRARVKSVQDGMGGVRDIMIDRTQHVFIADFRDIDARFREIQASTAFISDAPRRMVQSAGVVLILGMALLLTFRMGSAAAAIPPLGAMAIGTQRLLPLVQQIYQARSSFATYGVLLRDINAMVALPTAAEADPGEAPGKELEFRDRVACTGVRYTYPDASKPALAGVDITIEKGERIGFVGPSGSGKSTLIDLLMGLLTPQSGTVSIDGRPLLGATRAAWQNSIGHVPQSIFLTDGSIAENIAFGRRDIDREAVRAAARAAEIDTFIESLPEGYDTRMGEHGILLSGGQRQRIGIARALYKRPAVLVLDEATSALDDATEAAVIASLKKLGRDITILSIAHRMTSLKDCDRILRLEGGHVVPHVGQRSG